MSAAAAAKTVPPTKVVSAVPEHVLKKRQSLAKAQEKRAARAIVQKKAAKAARKTIFKRAEKYVKEYRAADRQLVRLRRQARSANNLFREPEAKVAFVFRIRGINGVAPKPRKILQLLRLRQINNGVFVRLTGATKAMLQRVEPFIAYGYPSLKSVRELVYKRGYAKVHGQRIPITDNRLIEKQLGKYGIICVEDIVHELYTCGPNFKAASKFLWPFKLSNPRGGWSNKNRHFVEGGDAGNREQHINKVLGNMI